MRSMIILFAFMGFFSSNTKAFEVNMDDIIRYGAPCAVSFIASSVLIKENGASVGMALCATTVAVSYTLSHDKKAKEIEYKISSEHEKMWKQIKINDERNRKELALFRDTIRRIVAEKVIEIQTKVDEKALKFLERKDIKDKITNIVAKMANERASNIINSLDPKIKKQRTKIIEEITNEVIKKIVSKKYAEAVSEPSKTDEEPITEDQFQ